MSDETIFVVDDDDDLRESIVEILADRGFQPIGCANAELALQKIKLHPPRLVIVDYMMPGMGGMALITLLKKDHPNVKIIMITAFSTVDNAVSAMKTGADDYLAKPFRRDDILVAVRRNLEEQKFARSRVEPDMDEILACLSNRIRRQILLALSLKKKMRFMDMVRYLEISDHTKVNFHLKNLKAGNLITQEEEKCYSLTSDGEKMVDMLHLVAQKISD
ncbi:MAG: response regulator [Desulfopila sp.]|jgi:DNA-binding NtrC family response regulator|nr:response regulator [Desulfopila sp.]